MQMTAAQARIIDPLVTQLALGYKSQVLIYQTLFPRVSVPVRAGRLPLFNTDTWRRFDTTHAPGANIPEIQVRWGSQLWSLIDRKLNGKVPMQLGEEAAAVPGINMLARSTNLVQAVIGNDLEWTAQSLARNAANYDAQHKLTLAGATLWRASTSTPDADVRTAKHNIRQTIGANPNTMVLSESTYYALQSNTNIQARFQYTLGSIISLEMLKAYFEVPNIVVGSASYLADDGTINDYWGTDAILAYVAPNGSTVDEPSYGYTLGLSGYPFATANWFNPMNASTIQPWHEAAQPYLTGIGSGYLFANAGG
jgi:hypothetical protein